MIGVIATLRVHSDQTDAFEAAFKALAGEVRAKEPGNRLYQLTRVRGEPGVYKVLELYVDQDAAIAHGESEHFKAGGLRPFLAGRPEIEFVDALD